MFQAKYIVIDHMTPVIFPETLTHHDVMCGLGGADRVCTGAGFVHINNQGSYTCWGHSVSLGVKSRGEEDARILNRYLGGPRVDL